MSVVAADQRHDRAPARRLAGRLDGDVVGLAGAGRKDAVAQRARGEAGQRFGEAGPRAAREVVVADIVPIRRLVQRRDDLRVTVTEIERPAVDVHVEQPSPVDVPEVMPLAATHHRQGAEHLECVDAPRTHVARRKVDNGLLLLRGSHGVATLPAVPGRRNGACS